MTYGYIRVSSDKQTVENQRFEINKFCKNENINIDGWIEEIPLPKIAENGLSIDEQIYKAFDFSKEEIDFIKSAIAKRKSEILQADISR